ncbi:unnamed protein product [Periconia digitata]|uniref:AAA+ ATPase domain-containing protein n=1 Tax=Periconia digitata TaxID=1303443 RepID=A0A9W4XFV1_9PLEO|nr:unnamed protein product [Periconia digitata]
MRLLHFDQVGRLLLTDFSGKTTPPYAILSHRWGDSEILFIDIANGTYREKEGYRKIEFCAKQAAKDHLQYFWIDTCCIDKWNLNELSKSINSMFLWYKNAEKCYVFLPDVSVPTASEAVPQSAWESFRTSAWFTRGWTLQELIAPGSVEFFSLEGQLLGDKQSLEQLLHAITRLPIQALQKFAPDDFTISERMGWADGRTTTEDEDIVYCLFGILNVSMSASYGEGRDKACIRLQGEMGNGAPFVIPFSQNENFVGQELHLADLEAMIFEDKQTTRIAIVGPGGTGKSQLALEFAYRTRKRNKNCSVFWIDASSKDGVHQSYTSIAQKLDIPGWNDEKANIMQIVKLHLSRRDAGQSLLIFDNADSVILGSTGMSIERNITLIDYLPRSDLCFILFTTTSRDAAKRLTSQETIEIRKMEHVTAQIMLEQYLNTPMAKTEKLEAKRLLKNLSHLPLAIVQAAAFINTRNITLHDYQSQLAKQQQRTLKFSSAVPEDTLQQYDIESPVAMTLHLSINQIRRESPLAARYLFLAACVNRKDILLDFLEAPSSREREDAIRIINSYKLVTRRPAESAMDLHRLVHDALRGWLWKQGILDEWTQTAIVRLSNVFPDDDYFPVPKRVRR